MQLNAHHSQQLPEIQTNVELKFPHLQQINQYTFKNFQEAAKLAAHIASLCPAHRRTFVELGLNELFINAIEHGNLQISFHQKTALKKNNQWHSVLEKMLDDRDHSHKQVQVYMTLTPCYLTIDIKDQGKGFDWNAFESQTYSPTSYHGRGIFMAKTLCFDKMDFLENGSRVRCIIYC